MKDLAKTSYNQAVKQKALAIIIFVLVLLPLPSHAHQNRINEIISQLKANFFQIKDVQGEMILDYKLHLFGCSGTRRLNGYGYFKNPNKGTCTLDGVKWFARGNRFYKIDQKGQRWYVKLLNSLDFGIGYHPGLISHNFQLKILKDSAEQIVLEGQPKPGIFKNAKKVIFYIDPKRYLLTDVEVKFSNERLSGKSTIYYKKIGQLWVPVGCQGKSAIELSHNLLIGLSFKLKTTKVKINNSLPDKLFEPGF